MASSVQESQGSKKAGIRRRPRSLWLGIGAMWIITASFVQTQSTYNVFVLNSVLIACFGAIALNLLMGTAGQVSIGNAAFLAVGAFAAVWSMRQGLAFPFDIFVAGAMSGVIGLIVGLPALRLRGFILALATLSAHFIILYYCNKYQTETPGAGASGFVFRPLFQSKGIDGKQHYWAWLMVTLVSVLLLVVSRLMTERSGRAWRMIRDHESAAPAFAIDVMRYKLSAFVLSSVLIGFEGGLAAHFSGSVSVDNFTLILAVSYIAMIVIGGIDSLGGAVVGAAIVVALPTVVSNVVSSAAGEGDALRNSPQIAQIVYGALVILFVVSSSGGIVGWLRSRQSWTARLRAKRRPPAGTEPLRLDEGALGPQQTELSAPVNVRSPSTLPERTPG